MRACVRVFAGSNATNLGFHRHRLLSPSGYELSSAAGFMPRLCGCEGMLKVKTNTDMSLKDFFFFHKIKSVLP